MTTGLSGELDAPVPAHGTPQIASIVAVLLMIVPALLYLGFVARYGVNVLAEDELYLTPVLDRLLTHVRFTDLWTQYAGHRMLFPRLLFIGFSLWTNLNIKDEMLLGAAFSVSAIALLIRLQYRRDPQSLWYLVPASFLMLSLTQYEQMLHGFAVAWYLVTLCFAIAATALDRLEENPRRILIAMLAAVVASFSCFQGLLVWPAASAYFIGRKSTYGAVWFVAAVLTIGAYFIGFDSSAQSSGTPSAAYAFGHPLVGMAFALVALGGPFNASGRVEGVQLAVVAVFGMAVAGFAIAVFAYAIRRRSFEPELRLPFALIVLGLTFVATLVPGRSAYGIDYALQPRFTAYTDLLLAGIYLAFVAARRSERMRYGLAGFAVLVVFAIVTGFEVASVRGPELLDSQRRAASALLAFDALTDDQIVATIDQYAPLARVAVPIAERRHFSVFGEARRPEPNLVPLAATTSWSLPPGFTLRGVNESAELSIGGRGSSVGKLYAGSPPIDVEPSTFYRISAVVDARKASGETPCFYVAELPGGLGLAMTCAVDGTVRAYSGVALIDPGVTQVKWEAYTNGTTLARGSALTYSAMALQAVGR